jgi:hypothetical protein
MNDREFQVACAILDDNRKLIAAAVLLLTIGTTAALAAQATEAAEATPIGLSCDGSVMDIVSPEPGAAAQPVKIKLVVDLAERTISGFDHFIMHIDSADHTSISFSGESFLGGDSTMMGNIDRVTGVTWAHTVTWTQRDKVIQRSSDWNLICKVTNRLF